MDIDMELLRRISDVKVALGSMDDPEGRAGIRTKVELALDRAQGYGPDAASALRAVAGALDEPSDASSSADLPERLGVLLDLLEQVVFDRSDERAADRLRGAVADLAPGPGDQPAEPEDPGRGDDTTEVDARQEEASLHSVAGYLVQMEPTLMDSVATLREHFSHAIQQWNGSPDVQAQLTDALGELDSVLSNKRTPKTKRAEAVGVVSEALEAAMEEEQDYMFWSPPGTEWDCGVSGTRAAQVGVGEDVDSQETEAGSSTRPDHTPENLVTAIAEEPDSAAPSGGNAKLTAMPTSIDADPELVIDFVAEGLEYLDQAEEALLGLESNPRDQELINVTFRAFHTIKGVSAFLELSQISGMAHEAETLLAQVREGSVPFTECAADLLLTAADVLRGLLEGVRELVHGGEAERPARLEAVIGALTDPDLAKKVARNESFGLKTEIPQAFAESEDDPARKDATGASSQDDSVRIRTERLDRLVDLVGELVVSYSMISQDPDLLGTGGGLKKKVGHSNKILRELQDLSTSLRMVPLKPAFHKISRVVRDVSRKSGKQVALVATGDETELDRSMVGVIVDPLVHMVRNSIDHGIESREARLAAGKPERGSVHLTARQAGGSVVVEIEDDGRGLDREKILAKALDRGLVDPEKTLTDSEVFDLIFHPGFSTADQVTDISGRGVGMDVVKRAVDSLRGRIEIQSRPGEGTRFSIHLPLTLAITDGMLVRIGGELCIIPTVKIQLSLRPTSQDLWSVSQRGEMVMLHGQLIPIARLDRVFGFQGGIQDPEHALLVVVGEGSRKTALMVDELLGQQQFVVKPLTGPVAGTPGVAGGAILGDGSVGLILDPEEVIDLAACTRSGSRAHVAA
jgi:two-component system chemotaxis sensor kinase CheA